ncbi:uncharacterized protein [Watersipora subatra]|uniref:uncharacterized protein n=1 Tax=Watersipora subatra TaxID=2589382 RepID=UPI00355BB306
MQVSCTSRVFNFAYRLLTKAKISPDHVFSKCPVLERTACGHVTTRFYNTTSLLYLSQRKQQSSRLRIDRSAQMVALHDEQNNYLKSLPYKEAMDYVHDNYDGKTIQPTKKENENGEMIARIVLKKKAETTFSIATSIEQAHLQVKVNNIRRKAESGLKVIVQFKEKPNGAPSKTVANRMQVLLDKAELLTEHRLVNDVLSLEITCKPGSSS